jgi:hypothetical protein
MDKKHCSRVTAGLVALLLAVGIVSYPQTARASGGSGGGGGGVKVDSIKVSKCFYDAPTGEMLIKAASSDPTARLFAYLPSGVLLGEVQNGGGSRYGGTVMGYQAFDPVMIGIVSTSGGSTTAPTTPFQP